MTDETAAAPQTETPSFAPKFLTIVLIVAAVVLAGLWMLSQSVEADRVRDTKVWQDKLDVIAESRSADVSKWLSDNYSELRSLADNPSLQLYMTDLHGQATQNAGKATPQIAYDSAQTTYLRNLLTFTAGRAGFRAESAKADDRNGLAVFGNDNAMLVATPMADGTKDIMATSVAKVAAGKEGLIDIQRDKGGALYIGFVVPVFSIQGEHDAESQIGRVVGLKSLDAAFFNLLKSPGATEKTLEVILVRDSDGEDKKPDYLTPLLDDTRPLTHPELGEKSTVLTALADAKGAFQNDKRDYRDKVVFATSRPIAGTPWSLVVKIDRQEAMADSTQRRVSKVATSLLLIAVIVLVVVALWWYAHSKRSMMLSGHFRQLATRSMAQENLLRLVADNQPEAITILDARQIVRFANRRAAENAQMALEHMLGKSLSDVRGAARAERIAEQTRRALAENRAAYEEMTLQEGADEKVLRVAFVPIDHIPVANLPAPTPGVLVIEQDISDVVHERERRLSTQQQLVQTLVRLVDKRDPFAANHSMLVSQIAGEIAAEMGLDEMMVETTHTAGSLMNIGKVFVPTELLTKTGSLTADERRVIRDSINAAADLVKDISFDGPVAETLRQWQEKWDGTGPLGLHGDSIMISARIIAAANAFIGMISPRSWRSAIPVAAANKFLMDQSDALFDRRVVVALVNYVENRSNEQWFNPITQDQSDRKAI